MDDENESSLDEEESPTHMRPRARQICPAPTESDEDSEYEPSENVHLQRDLEQALDDSNFSFPGTFYHAGRLPSAPNPCLQVSGIGVVGLPLSSRDAIALISCATLAPFGHGERTVVDKEVRDTWEIEPAQLTFANPQWHTYMQDVVCAEVCKSLGVDTSQALPQIELYKLLLYEKGSHFLPHQDTQKANGMFATVIIILPSAYTGGQVVLTHSSKQETIDFSADSLLSAAVLAWYTDVKHEVKEVVSGYRLALSYNLIHVASPGAPPPTLPDTRESLMIQQVLEKWRNGDYCTGSQHRVLACLLQHQYSPRNLKDGIKALKGADAYRVTLVRSIAETLGFAVGIANLEHNVCGSPDESYGYMRRRFHYDSECESDEEETPRMVEVGSVTTSIKDTVDLNGSALFPVGTQKIRLDDDCLIPRHAFKGKQPDSANYEGYQGNYAGRIDHWYRRTAFILVRESDVDEICYKAGGVDYAYDNLKKSSVIPPTDKDKLWAERLLQVQNSVRLTKDHVLTLMTYALKWQDLAVWKGVMKCSPSTLKNMDHALFLTAWELFAFKDVCVSFEELLARSTDLSEKVNFIHSLSSQTTDKNRKAVEAWCRKETCKVISPTTPLGVENIPTIMRIIQKDGLEFFSQAMMPHLLTRYYAFLMALRTALIDGRKSIIEQQVKHQRRFLSTTESSVEDPGPTSAQDKSVLTATSALLDNLVKRCLETAALRWSDGFSYSNSSRELVERNPPESVTRITQIVDLAYATNNMGLINPLLVNVLDAQGDTAAKFRRLYIPLIPHLKATLSRIGRDSIFAPPFVDFLEIIIATYLRDVLGKKGAAVNPNINLRKIGCGGCADCALLDKFIMHPSLATTTFRIVKERRVHVERRAAAAADLCAYVTVTQGRPHGVALTRRPEVVATASWRCRQQSAREFLAAVGSDADVARVMGARYADVGRALEGREPFGGPVRAAVSLRTAGPTVGRAPSETRGTILAAASSSAVPPPPPPAPAAPQPTLAGTKRKSSSRRQALQTRPARATVQLGPVIDLTEEDCS